MMQDHVFRKYDLRGEVGKDFAVDDIYNVAKAIAFYFKQKDNSIKNIALGMDGRIHSQSIKEQITKALIDSGLNVIFIGLCPTPAVYFAMHTLDIHAGIMITASHNPAQDNGLKILINKIAIWSDEIQEIKKLYKSNCQINTNQKGHYSEKNIIEDYINYIIDKFTHLKNLNINCAVDCANGTAGAVMPLLIQKMNWKNVKLLFEEIDGRYPNHEPDPSKEKNLLDLKKHLLTEQNCEFGIGLDGDCDRVALMSKSGYLLPGDELLGIFSQFISTNDSNNTVVFDITCSTGLVKLLKETGLTPYMTPTGNSYIKDIMKKTNASLGGEFSGHFCFNDRYFGYDDGIYALMRIVEIIIASKKTVQELLQLFPKQISSPSFRIECPEEKKSIIIDNAKKTFGKRKDLEIIDIDGIRIHSDYGCGVLRASNTQPMLSLRFESSNEADLKKIKEEFYETMTPYFDNVWLRRQLEL